jgi:lipoprotein-releasing system permease protein
MYKLLLCWRYLRTRWIALASVISVTLGVATMIVVNAVMAGFSHEMQTRIHGILSDIVFESHSLSGFQDPKWHMDEIRRADGDQIAGMTPTVAVPAMLNFQVRGQWVTRQVMFIGIDESSHAQASDFGRFLQHPENRRQLSFNLREQGYDTVDSQSEGPGPTRPALEGAGWPHRRMRVERERLWRERQEQQRTEGADGGQPVRPVDHQVDAVLAATAPADATAKAGAVLPSKIPSTSTEVIGRGLRGHPGRGESRGVVREKGAEGVEPRARRRDDAGCVHADRRDEPLSVWGRCWTHMRESAALYGDLSVAHFGPIPRPHRFTN